MKFTDFRLVSDLRDSLQKITDLRVEGIAQLRNLEITVNGGPAHRFGDEEFRRAFLMFLDSQTNATYARLERLGVVTDRKIKP